MRIKLYLSVLPGAVDTRAGKKSDIPPGTSVSLWNEGPEAHKSFYIGSIFGLYSFG
jgi:hypothetical protein